MDEVAPSTPSASYSNACGLPNTAESAQAVLAKVPTVHIGLCGEESK